MRSLIAALLLVVAAPARGQEFDYYLLALSWSPSWCEAEGRGAARAEQCAPERDLGFVLHGLWPQYEEGWPEHCDAASADPSRRQTAAMADAMGSGGLAWHAWVKHGRCTGLGPADYFDLSRLALGRVALPPLEGRMTARSVAAAFVAANAGLEAAHLAVTCREGLLREVRVCLTRELGFRTCGEDVARAACRSRDALALPAPP